MAAVLPGSPPRRDTVWQRLRALSLMAEVSNPLIGPPLALAPPWTPSTTYGAGAVVSNGGNLYECYTGGTTDTSGGPSGTGPAVITDGTAGWVYAGAPQTSATSPLLPTITNFNGGFPSGLDKRYEPGSTLTESVVRVVGGGPRLEYGVSWRFPCVTLFPGQSNVIGDGLMGVTAGLEFRTDAPKVAFVWAYPNPFRLLIDGVRVWPGMKIGGVGNGQCGPMIDFSTAGGRKDRLWRIEFHGNVDLRAIYVDAASTISYPHAADAIWFINLGDSLSAGGAGFPIVSSDIWVDQLGKRMGWGDTRVSGVGGTGYTTGGSGRYPKPIERLVDLSGADIAGFAFGTNDGGTAASLTAAALACFRAARAALPGIPILVWGTPASVQKTLSAAADTENAVFGAVAQANDDLLIPIPVSTDPVPWFTDVNVAAYISSDGVHGTNAWHAHFAARSATALGKVIALLA